MTTKYYGRELKDQPYAKEINSLWGKYYKLKGNKEKQRPILSEINELEIKQAEELNL